MFLFCAFVVGGFLWWCGGVFVVVFFVLVVMFLWWCSVFLLVVFLCSVEQYFVVLAQYFVVLNERFVALEWYFAVRSSTGVVLCSIHWIIVLDNVE